MLGPSLTRDRIWRTAPGAWVFPTTCSSLLLLLFGSSSFAQFTHSDINPNQSDLHATDPDGATGGRVNGLAAVAGNNTVFYAASEWGGIYKSSDAGLTWARLDRHLPSVTWDVEVDPSNTNRVYATSFYDGKVSSLAGINVSTDAGNTWTRPASATPPAGLCAAERRTELSGYGISIDPAAPQNVYIGTSCGLAISNDSGVTWSFVDPTPADPAENVWDVVVHAGGIIDVCGDDGHLRSTDGGTTWTSGIGLPSGRCSIAASPDEANVLFVAVARDIYESDDGGGTWTNLGTPDSRRQGRIPFVATNDRAGNAFDLWYGDVRLFRGGCTSNPAGGGLRCPTAYVGALPSPAPPPAGWNGPYTRSVGGHDDVGDIVFDSQAGIDACPMIFSSDGGVYYNTATNSPGCHTPAWQQPNVTPHGLWLWALDGAHQTGISAEDIYFGCQDNGTFAATDGGAANPTWTNRNCCDGFDDSADPARILYTVCCGGARANRMYLRGQGMAGGGQINTYPADGLLPGFRFPDVIDRFGNRQYVVISRDCNTPPDGIDNDGDGQIDEPDETKGCSGVNGGDGGVYITNDVTATPIVWTELGDATEPPSNQLCGVQAAVSGGTPTFYVQTGNCSGSWQDAVWRYVGTAAGNNWQQVNPPAGGFGVFAVDPNNPNRLLASVISNFADPQMVISDDGGATWRNLPQLDELMTGAGAFRYRTQGYIGYGRYAQPSLVALDPEDPNILVAGGMDSGVFISQDGGEDWRLATDPIDSGNSGTPHLPQPRFAYFDHEPSNEVRLYIGTRGRGVWRIAFFRAPVADADGPYTTDVGVAQTLDGTGSTDADGGALTYEWDFDGDGNFNDAVGPTPAFGGSFVAISGTFPVALRVTDPDGASDEDETIVTVTAMGMRTALSLHAGVALPLGTLNTSTNLGPTINADLLIPITRQLGADLRLGYSLFNGSGGASDVDIWNLSLNLKYIPALTTPWFFVNGGIGLYYIDTTDLEGGFNLGIGAGQPISSNLDVELTLNYHRTFTASPDLEYAKVQLGLIWAF